MSVIASSFVASSSPGFRGGRRRVQHGSMSARRETLLVPAARGRRAWGRRGSPPGASSSRIRPRTGRLRCSSAGRSSGAVSSRGVSRPRNRLGPAMVFTGFAWFATFLTDAHGRWPFTVGTALQSVYLVGFVFIVLSFPSGRLQGRARPRADLGGGRARERGRDRLVALQRLGGGAVLGLPVATRSRSRGTTASRTASCRGSASAAPCWRCSRSRCSFGAGARRAGRSGGVSRRCCGPGARRSRCWRSRS